MDSPDLTLDAAHVEWVDGRAVATGAPVRAWWGGSSLEAERVEVEGDLVRVTAGEVRRDGASFRFTAGEWNLATGAAELTGATYSPPGACEAGSAPLLTADTLRLDPAGTWTVEGGVVLPCPCVAGAPVVAVSARRAEVVPEHHVVVHGGALRILGIPLVPVPWARIALDPDAFRLGLPEVGYGDPGLSLAWSGSGGVAGWRLQAGPAWRQDRGLRLDAEARGGPGTLRGSVGWDALEGQARGALAGRGGVVGAGSTRAGWDLAWQSDRAWRDDYGLDYVARGVLWVDSRVAVGGGPLVGTFTLADDGSRGEVVGLRQAWHANGAARRWGVDVWARQGLVGDTLASGPLVAGADGPLLDDPDVRLAAGAALRGSRTWGPVHLEARVDGEGWLYGRDGAGGRGRAEARAEVPVWSELRGGGGRVQWWPGLLVDARVRAGAAEVGDDLLLPAPALAGLLGGAGGDSAWLWSGAALRADTRLARVGFEGELRLGASPVPSTATAAASSDELLGASRVAVAGAGGAADGFRFDPQLRAAVTGERVGARVYATLDGASGEVRGTFGPGAAAVSPWVGGWWSGVTDGALAWGGVDGRWRRLVYGGSVTLQPGATDAFTGAVLRAGYDDGCARLVVSGALSPDRALPDLSVAVALRR